MDLHRLAVFAKVYELKSVSRSAEEVFLSQPTVSGHLKALEEELGVRLFDRLGRGVAPTQAAEVLYEHARRLLALRDKAVQEVGAVSGKVRGRLNLGGSTIPGHYLLPAYLGRMRVRYPELTISLSVGGSSEIGLKVESGHLEMGVIGVRLERSRLVHTPCHQDELVLIVPADHPLAGQGIIEASELTSWPFVVREAGSGTRMKANQALVELGLKASELKVVGELGSTEAVRRAVLAGLGCSFISRLAVEEDILAGRLAPIEIKGLNLTRDFFVVVRAGRSLSPGAERLAEMLIEEAENGD